MRRSCSARSKARRPIRTIRRRRACTPPPARDYTRFLRRDGLRGARIGIPRAFFYDRAAVPGAVEPRGGLDARSGEADGRGHRRPASARAPSSSIPADIPSVVDKDPQQNFALWGICSGANNARGSDADCSIVFKYGMKRDFNKWLASLGRRRR